MTLPETDIAPKKMGWLEVWKFPFWENPIFRVHKLLVLRSVYGCFRKWWYPQIIHFHRDFHYKIIHFGGFPPYFWETANILPFHMNQPPKKNQPTFTPQILPST